MRMADKSSRSFKVQYVSTAARDQLGRITDKTQSCSYMVRHTMYIQCINYIGSTEIFGSEFWQLLVRVCQGQLEQRHANEETILCLSEVCCARVAVNLWPDLHRDRGQHVSRLQALAVGYPVQAALTMDMLHLAIGRAKRLSRYSGGAHLINSGEGMHDDCVL